MPNRWQQTKPLTVDKHGDIDLTGCIPSDLNPDTISEGTDFEALCMILSDNYNADFLTINTANHNTAKLVYQNALCLGWSVERFRQHLGDFLKRNRFATFTVADFFSETTELKLKSHAKYVEALNTCGESLNSQIHRFRLLNAAKTDLAFFWCEQTELTDYQVSYLREQESKDFAHIQFKRKAERDAEETIRSTAAALNEATAPKQLTNSAMQAKQDNARLVRINKRLLEEIDGLKALIFRHSEHPETLLQAAGRIDERIQKFVQETSVTVFPELTNARGN